MGFLFTDFYTLPGYEFSTLEAHDACVANGAMSQLLLWFGARAPARLLAPGRRHSLARVQLGGTRCCTRIRLA